MTEFLNNLLFIFQRLNLLSVVDILLVTLIFFALLSWLRDTQAMVLLRGVILIVVALILLTSLVDLPAFSWLVRNSVPALLFSIPVVFAPEIRRALERIGRAGNLIPTFGKTTETDFEQSIHAVVTAAARLSARQHGALIILQRLDNLDEYIESGVRMNAIVTAGLMCAPLTRCEQSTPTYTPSAQPAVMTIQPELLPLVRESTTLATTPLPKIMRIAVPMNSARLAFMSHSESSHSRARSSALAQRPRR